MDMQTGEIKRFHTVDELKSEQAVRAVLGVPPLAEMSRAPKQNCNKCHGKGFTGTNIDTGLKQLCKCVL